MPKRAEVPKLDITFEEHVQGVKRVKGAGTLVWNKKRLQYNAHFYSDDNATKGTKVGGKFKVTINVPVRTQSPKTWAETLDAAEFRASIAMKINDLETSGENFMFSACI